MTKPKCVIDNCPEEAYYAEGIYHSQYCESHLEMDDNLKPFTDEEAEEFFKNHDLDTIEKNQALKLKELIEKFLSHPDPNIDTDEWLKKDKYARNILRGFLEESKK